MSITICSLYANVVVTVHASSWRRQHCILLSCSHSLLNYLLKIHEFQFVSLPRNACNDVRIGVVRRTTTYFTPTTWRISLMPTSRKLTLYSISMSNEHINFTSVSTPATFGRDRSVGLPKISLRDSDFQRAAIHVLLTYFDLLVRFYAFGNALKFSA